MASYPAALHVLRKVTRVAAVIILVLVALGFFLPTDYKVERSVVIHAPRDFVYQRMLSGDRLPGWLHVQGGKVATFDGMLEQGDSVALLYDDSKDSGFLKVITTSGSQVRFDVRPKQNVNLVHNEIALQAIKDGTQVTWTIRGELNAGLVSPYLAMFANDIAGSNFESSLQALKEQVELSSEKH